jgi:hypothetical protein
MDLFPNIRRHEYEFLDGGLDTALFERQAMVRSELRMLYPDLERYFQEVLCRFATETTPSVKSASRSMDLMQPIRLTAIIAVFSVRKAAWRNILPEQGRSGMILAKSTVPPPAESSVPPQVDEMLERFRTAFPAMKALVPHEDDFKGDLPLFIDYARKEALFREQTLRPDDIRHAVYMTLEPDFMLPFPRLSRFIDERAHRAYQSFRRAGARDDSAARAYQFAQLLPTIGAATMVHHCARARRIAQAVDS